MDVTMLPTLPTGRPGSTVTSPTTSPKSTTPGPTRLIDTENNSMGNNTCDELIYPENNSVGSNKGAVMSRPHGAKHGGEPPPSSTASPISTTSNISGGKVTGKYTDNASSSTPWPYVAPSASSISQMSTNGRGQGMKLPHSMHAQSLTSPPGSMISAQVPYSYGGSAAQPLTGPVFQQAVQQGVSQQALPHPHNHLTTPVSALARTTATTSSVTTTSNIRPTTSGTALARTSAKTSSVTKESNIRESRQRAAAVSPYLGRRSRPTALTDVDGEL